ncbi:MAG: hypothetical protein KAW56_14495 [Candidatus Marinimicrobia bacterium]|nr:hypothetical protein [Candidatus Neomarinimicrobiota bacterium]MCK4448277.1 hypothetical protein [Candidatus Neomarinimicrobiota bacterium]
MTVDQFNKQQLILARSAARGIETFIKSIESDLLILSEIMSVRMMGPDVLEKMRYLYLEFPTKSSSRRLDKNILRFIYPN